VAFYMLAYEGRKVRTPT